MEHIILMLVSMIVVYHIIQVVYHACFRVVYWPSVSKLILGFNIVSIVFAAVLTWKHELGFDGSVILVLSFMLGLTILNSFILQRNWKKYTVASFVQNGIYEFEVQGLNHGFVFGRIYWDRKKYPDVYCTGWLYAHYMGRSFAERRAEYIKNSNMKVGDVCKVSFMEKSCFPYYSIEPNRGNIVKLIKM